MLQITQVFTYASTPTDFLTCQQTCTVLLVRPPHPAQQTYNPHPDHLQSKNSILNKYIPYTTGT